jgi:hypothetical protein
LNEQELYKVYATWSGQLHFWVLSQFHRHIDCEFLPFEYKFQIHDRPAEVHVSSSGIPHLARPEGRSISIRLPRPEEDPSKAELDEIFRVICLAAARVMEIDVSIAWLED